MSKLLIIRGEDYASAVVYVAVRYDARISVSTWSTKTDQNW
jgi:hypothetical protein